jgi:Bacterial regulatory proteins, tetR family
VLAEVAANISTADVPDSPCESVAGAKVRRVSGVDPSKYEALLTESVLLFNRKSYRDTTMEEIASAVGMPTSGIYRYFSAKLRATSSPRYTGGPPIGCRLVL